MASAYQDLRSLVYQWVEWESCKLFPKRPYMPKWATKIDARVSKKGAYVFEIAKEGLCDARSTNQQPTDHATKMVEFGVAFRGLPEQDQLAILWSLFGHGDGSMLARELKIAGEVVLMRVVMGCLTFAKKKTLWKRSVKSAWMRLGNTWGLRGNELRQIESGSWEMPKEKPPVSQGFGCYHLSSGIIS
jgi:hypothetical protein